MVMMAEANVDEGVDDDDDGDGDDNTGGWPGRNIHLRDGLPVLMRPVPLGLLYALSRE